MSGSADPAIQSVCSTLDRVNDDSTFTIRLATAADQARVEHCVTAAYEHYVEIIGRPPAPMTEDYARLISEGVVHVAQRDGSILGLIVMWPESDHYYVDNLAVFPYAQGSGLGRVLLHEAEAAARRSGLNKIMLYTNELMTANLAYYPRRGFVETHRSTDSGYSRVYFVKQLTSADAAT